MVILGEALYCHSPLEGSGGAVMNSKTMYDGKGTIATLYDGGENGSSVFSMNGSELRP